ELRARMQGLEVQPPQVQPRRPAVLEAGGQGLVSGRVVAIAQGGPGEVDVAAGHVLEELAVLREGEAPLELLAPGGVASEQLHRADRVERVLTHLDVVEAVGELERTAAPGQRA